MSSVSVIEEMILGLPRPEQAIMNRLRALVHECLPTAIEKAYYDEGYPFYSHHRLICFIWPPSSRMAPKRVQEAKAVTLGFCQGYLMSNQDKVLQSEGRKQVYVMYFHSLDEVDDDQIRALLYEADMIDQTFKKKKKAATKK